VTQFQLDHFIASLTGEAIGLVRRLGFSVLAAKADALEPEDFQLVLDCPFCGHPVPYPGQTGDGSDILAECDGCDVYFPFRAEEVYTIATDRCTEESTRALRYGRASWPVE
jgi:hypothetical protein